MLVSLSGIPVFSGEIFELDKIVVKSEEKLKDDEIDEYTMQTKKVADISEILANEMAEVNIIRKGGYGNEVSVRGFGKSNLRVTVDGSIVEGACGSRKDPSLSHINMLSVDKIKVRQGPFDVTEAGALGGGVSVITRNPAEDFDGVVSFKTGSFGFFSGGTVLSGGNSSVQGLFGYNFSRSGQYIDGNGEKLGSFSPAGRPLQKEKDNIEAFRKNDLWGKLKLIPFEKQELLLSFSYGVGQDILAPRVGMDIEEEKTILANAEYTVKTAGKYSDRLKINIYRNSTGHNPSDKNRVLVGPPPFNRSNEVLSVISGGKIENLVSAGKFLLTYGSDIYFRNWDGEMYNDLNKEVMSKELFPDVDEVNAGYYLQADRKIGSWFFSSGIRLDHFSSEAGDTLYNSQSYLDTKTNERSNTLPSGYVSCRNTVNENLEIFAAAGQSARTPTAAERYLQPPRGAAFAGNPDLEPTVNREIDAGFEALVLKEIRLKLKGFYSSLTDYIYQQAPPQTWCNIDAEIYGADAGLSVKIIETLGLDVSAAYQRGNKKTFPENNSDEDLSEIPPLKTKAGLRYQKNSIFGSVDWIYSDKFGYADTDAGEKTMDSWNILNIGAGFEIGPALLSAGIENLLNKRYASANSYEWDVVSGSAADPSIINEPGRNFYTGVSVKF